MKILMIFKIFVGKPMSFLETVIWSDESEFEIFRQKKRDT